MLHFQPRRGAKVFYDSSLGLLPAIIVDVQKDGEYNWIDVVVKLTIRKKVGPYRPGELLLTSHLRAVPRKAVRRGRILPYTYELN